METMEAIAGRRSIRAFESTAVSDEIVEELVRLANLAPSAGNLQAREFIIVRDEERRVALAEAAGNQTFIADAPVSIVVCANFERILHYGQRGRDLYVYQDTAAAIQNILLASHAMGLGSVWVGAFREDPVSRMLKLPEYIRPVAIIPVGHPAENPQMKSRRPISEIMHVEEW